MQKVCFLLRVTTAKNPSLLGYLTLLYSQIQTNSQLEGSLSQWTSYQEDVRQFVAWVERVEESLDPTDKQCPEMRDKTANLSKAKVLQSAQSHVIYLHMHTSHSATS